MEDSTRTYNGVAVISSIEELSWEPTWRLSLAESNIGRQFSHLGYTEPVYTDLYEFACGFYRPFTQSERKYPDYGEEGLIATYAETKSPDTPFLRQSPDVI